MNRRRDNDGGGQCDTNFADNHRTSMTVNERDPKAPVLYKPDGTALHIPKSPVGFVRPKG